MRAAGWFLICLAIGLAGCVEKASFAPPPAGGPVLEKRLVAAGPTSDASAQIVEVGGYVLRPGDHVSVRVWREDSLTGSYEIGPDGIINLPLIGEIKADGLTEAQFQQEVTRKYSEYLKDPHIEVTVSQKRFFIGGAVLRPGAVEIGSPITLDQALILAGGLAPEGDLGLVSIVRNGENGTEVAEIDASVDGGLRIEVRPGDRITIGKGSRSTIKVMGEVRVPGPVIWRDGMTATDAIIEAGGFTEFAAENKVEVKRGSGPESQTFKVKVGKIIQPGGDEEDLLLMPGDLIRVPSSIL